MIISSAEKVRTRLLVTHLREDHSGGLFSWSHSDRRWICPGVGRKGGEGRKWGLRWIRDRGRRLAQEGTWGWASGRRGFGELLQPQGVGSTLFAATDDRPSVALAPETQ